MKKLLITLLVFAAMTFAASNSGSGSQSKNMAIGGWFQAGNPGEHAGLDFMMRSGKDVTIDIYGHLFLSSDESSFGIYLGYFWNFYLPVPKDAGRIGFYVGPTGGFGIWDVEQWHSHWENNHWVNDWWRDEFGFAIRIGATGGFQWEFPVIPLQLYLELNPVCEFHYLSWDDYYDRNGNVRPGRYDDDDVEWKFPDFYFRVGLRFWF